MQARRTPGTLSNDHPRRDILRLTWPVLVEDILGVMVNYVDTAMVGSLGAIATASVSLGGPLLWMINGLFMSLGVGFTALLSRSVGAEDHARAQKIVRHIFLCVLVMGIPLTALNVGISKYVAVWMGGQPEILPFAADYNFYLALSLMFRVGSMMLNSVFRGYGDNKTPMYINLVVNGLNVILNFFFIFPTRLVRIFGSEVSVWGMGLGVAGAAIATSIAATIGFLIAVYLLFIHPRMERINLRKFWVVDWKLTGMVIKISVPAMLQRFSFSFGSIIITRTIATLGTVAVAANSLYLTAESMCFMPGSAFSTACTILVGQSLGAKLPDRAVKYVASAVRMAGIMMLVMGSVMFLGAPYIMRIFTQDEAVLTLATLCLRVCASEQIPQSWAGIFQGTLQGAGDTKWVFYISAISRWGVRILGSVTLILVFDLGLMGACIGMCADNFVGCLLYYLRYRTGKWKTAIKDEDLETAPQQA